MFLGIDIGTSSVKAILVDHNQKIVAQETVELTVSRPLPEWSEQQPEDWWHACIVALSALRKSNPEEYKKTLSIGMSGQMHGAVLLDVKGSVLRPAILWNDGRCSAQCITLENRVPRLKEITGNLAMPGFTAPKLLWVAENEPDIFKRIDKVLLPKDYIRYRMSGVYCSDMSDAAGTLWLDVAERTWSSEVLNACGLELKHMPKLCEGSNKSAELSDNAATELNLPAGITIAGGGGDNACAAVGIGAVQSGQSFLSLGTSGVYFVANQTFSPNPDQGMHAFCHSLPKTWHQMSVALSAASCLDWVAKLTGCTDVAALLNEIETQQPEPTNILFLPYLSGERTPHNDPDSKGVFFGLTHSTTRAELGRSVLEGVAFSFADGQQALIQGGAEIGDVSVIGGGSRSRLWGEIIASVLQRPLNFIADGEFGPAFGAARLARLAHTNETAIDVCTSPAVIHVQKQNSDWTEHYSQSLSRYQDLYLTLKATFKKCSEM